MPKIASLTLDSTGNGGAGGFAVKAAVAKNKARSLAVQRKAKAALKKDEDLRSTVTDRELLKTLDSYGK
jgi:hypothetical protein